MPQEWVFSCVHLISSKHSSSQALQEGLGFEFLVQGQCLLQEKRHSGLAKQDHK